MPKQTFFNLSEAKRKKLLDAIRAEFSRVPYEQVSINQIIRAAGIPRGSFYQYFEDKRDVLNYLLGEYKRESLEQARRSLAQNGGDLFGMLLDLLDFTHAFLALEANNAFCRNVFSDVRHNLDILAPQEEGDAYVSLMREVLDGVDRTTLDLRAPADFENLTGILVPLTGYAFAQAFYDTANYGAVRAQFAARLELLRRGFSKRAHPAPGMER